MAASSGADSAATFAIEDEDSTLANALTFMLNKNPHVTSCGYSIPHPTESLVNIRIQTTAALSTMSSCIFGAGGDVFVGPFSGEISAAQALREACHNVKNVCSHMKTTFKAAMDDYRASSSDHMEE